MLKKFIIISIFSLALLANSFSKNNDTYIQIDSKSSNSTIVLSHNKYKIITFDKQISDIRLSNNRVLSIDFEDNSENPLTQIKAFGKNIGIVNMLITFADDTTLQLGFKVTRDITQLKDIVHSIAPEIELVQLDNAIILKGKSKDNKIKNKIIKMLEDSFEKIKIVDLVKVQNPDKMIRLKMYVVEINNKKGEIIKNNWSVGYKNYTRRYLQDKESSVEQSFLPVLANSIESSVTLSGGLTAGANYLADRFNTGLTLQYLKTNGVAKVLDETTLVTLEHQESKFLAGGNLLIETKTTSSDGQPISNIEKFPYGLNLKINVKDIVNNKYITLEIDTVSSTLDIANGVGILPATKEKSIKTKVVVANNATIVLGGLINNSNSKDYQKIPLLGDIPIIGALFRSKSFQKGNSELVFFITPTIVEPNKNNQINKFKNMKNSVVPSKKVIKKVEKKTTLEEEHEKRVKEILGI